MVLNAFRPHPLAVVSALVLAGLCGPATAQTREPSALQVSIWAASCMACHGPEGRAEGTGMTIGGRPAEDLYGKLLAHKTGQRQGTIMHQHAKGYSDDELRRISEHLSQLK